MKIAITGSTGLAKAIAGALQDHEVIHCRIEIELPFDVDVFINNAHIGYNQIDILHHLYKEWWAKDSKYIINISSRAHQPNISKGYLYASQKAALNHLANNLIYNSDKKCRISTINFGLLDHPELPCLTHEEAASWVKYLVNLPKNIEVPEITVHNSANYRDVQSDKEMLQDMEWLGLK